MRQALANEPNIKVVGDRFVFESDVLFPVDQATLTPAGQAEIAQVAKAVKEIAGENPGQCELGAVRGRLCRCAADHRRAVSIQFRSVLRARADGAASAGAGRRAGEPDSATSGMGANNPMAPGNTPADYAQNRRIEFRLTTP